MEQLDPVPNDELEIAADLLENFKYHWERLEGDEQGRHELVKLIVERVYVRDKEEVMAMTLRSDFHLILGHKKMSQPILRLTPDCPGYHKAGKREHLIESAIYSIFQQ